MNECAINFWERVKSCCKQQGLTQEEMSKSAGVNFYNLKQQIFHKRLPNVEEAVLIAKALNTSVEYLVTGEETNPSKEELDSLKSELKALAVKHHLL